MQHRYVCVIVAELVQVFIVVRGLMVCEDQTPQCHTRRAKIQNSAGTPCRLMHRCILFTTKTRSSRGELASKTFCYLWNMFVKQFTMKTLSAKPSLSHFLCWKSPSLRAGFVNQSSPFMLPPILAISCETEFALPSGCCQEAQESAS